MSVRPDDTELITRRVLKHACSPLAGLRRRERRGTRLDHLVDHRKRVLDEEIEMQSRLGNFGFRHLLERQMGGPSAPSGLSIVT
jgi:hypothetical protein